MNLGRTQTQMETGITPKPTTSMDWTTHINELIQIETSGENRMWVKTVLQLTNEALTLDSNVPNGPIRNSPNTTPVSLDAFNVLSKVFLALLWKPFVVLIGFLLGFSFCKSNRYLSYCLLNNPVRCHQKHQNPASWTEWNG